jgi:hypothetical protein
MELLRFSFRELPRAFDKFEPAHRGAMIIPYRQVPSDKASRACHPVIGYRIARASDPHHNVVVLDFDQEFPAQHYCPRCLAAKASTSGNGRAFPLASASPGARVLELSDFSGVLKVVGERTQLRRPV